MSNTSENKPNKKHDDVVETTDYFLQKLVKIVNKCAGPDEGFPITLNVGGLLISGKLASGKRYFEAVAKDLAFGVKDVKEAISKLGNIYEEKSENDEKSQASTEPVYIHLENARFCFAGQNPIPGNRPIWWRGRISRVDGFMIGCLSAEIKEVSEKV